jgi:transcriptional regulator GlxA family with amidase domain
MTPMEKVWLLRLQEAARLLGQTGLGIAEVAYLTGFANPYHFSRRFKAHFGMQPSLWRQTKWGHPSDLSGRAEE